MYVMLVCEDKTKDKGWCSEDDPPWEEVEHAIRRLDGRLFIDLYIAEKEDVGMNISGGYKNRYFCQVIFAEDDVAVLKNPQGSRTHQVAITEFGAADFPMDEVIELETILRAARTYAESGGLDETLPFER